MLLPNSCSAAAHQRIHQGVSPHVCPECGASARQPLFQRHLDEACFHFARRIGYRYVSGPEVRDPGGGGGGVDQDVG